jgi:hypothetical protein
MPSDLLSQSLPSADAADVRPDRSEADATCGFSVADLCRRWKIGAEKIRGFLRRGELVGINVATNLSARPQWRITRQSVDLFERRRSSAPVPRQRRKERRQPQEIDYYPD